MSDAGHAYLSMGLRHSPMLEPYALELRDVIDSLGFLDTPKGKYRFTVLIQAASTLEELRAAAEEPATPVVFAFIAEEITAHMALSTMLAAARLSAVAYDERRDGLYAYAAIAEGQSQFYLISVAGFSEVRSPWLCEDVVGGYLRHIIDPRLM
jgi:hypothetical protein